MAHPPPPVAADSGELAPINPIRTEIITAKLPIHQLSKKGKIDISIIHRDTKGGQITFRWEVSYTDRYGVPRQLAYKTEKLIIDRRIDEHPKPIPRYLKIGDLREICRQLKLGGNTNKAKTALHQNASTYITVKLSYTAQDGTTHYIEQSNTRYRLIFRGQELPDGTRAETVYIAFNDPFLQIINSSPTRPLDYDYLRQLPPAPQRFYELLSFQMFAAIKNRHLFARLRYSEFCGQAPQTRYYDRRHMQIQMAKIHRLHTESGYITRPVRYDNTTDDDGKPDWFILYTPGPKARAEFETFHRKRPRHTAQKTIDLNPAPQPPAAPAGQGTPPSTDLLQIDQDLLSQLSHRGVIETIARDHLSRSANHDHIADCIDYWDTITSQKGAGLLVDLIRKKISLPNTFETRAKRKHREEAEARHQELFLEKQELENAYEDYKRQQIDRYIADQLTADEHQYLLQHKKTELAKQYTFWSQNPSRLTRMAEQALRADLEARLTLATFDEFSRRERASYKPVDAPKPPQTTET